MEKNTLEKLVELVETTQQLLNLVKDNIRTVSNQIPDLNSKRVSPAYIAEIISNTLKLNDSELQCHEVTQVLITAWLGELRRMERETSLLKNKEIIEGLGRRIRKSAKSDKISRDCGTALDSLS